MNMGIMDGFNETITFESQSAKQTWTERKKILGHYLDSRFYPHPYDIYATRIVPLAVMQALFRFVTNGWSIMIVLCYSETRM